MIRLTFTALAVLLLSSATAQSASLADLLGLDEALISSGAAVATVDGADNSFLFTNSNGGVSNAGAIPSTGATCGSPSFSTPSSGNLGLLDGLSSGGLGASGVQTVNITVNIDIDITFNGSFCQPAASPSACR